MKKVSFQNAVIYVGFAFVMSTFSIQMSLLAATLFGFNHPLV